MNKEQGSPPLLTVGIPIFNGAKNIQQTIDSLEKAFELLDHKNMVEIVFCDNASTDESENIIRKFLTKTHYIGIYFRQKKNVGFDLNLDTIINLSSATYVWFLGCGETVKYDSMYKLMDKLRSENEYTNVLVDFDIFEELQNKITDEKTFLFNDDTLLEGNDNFQYVKYGLAVSSNIVNRLKWLDVSKLDLVVDGWCHVERILSMIANDAGSRTLLLPSAYFTLYRDKNGWWTKPDSYIPTLRYIVIIRHVISQGFYVSYFKNLEKRQIYVALVNALLQAKVNGLKVDKNLIFEMMKMFKKYIFFWVVILPGLLLPTLFLKSIRFVTRKLGKYVKKCNF